MINNAKVGEKATALAAKAPAVPADREELVEDKAKAEAVVMPAKAIEQKAMDKPMTKKIAKEITREAKKNAEHEKENAEHFAKLTEECVTAKVEAEKRAAALKKAKLDMSMDKQWARQIFQAGWEGRTSRDSFETCFETVWRRSTQGYF